jgi:hypothetical protein
MSDAFFQELLEYQHARFIVECLKCAQMKSFPVDAHSQLPESKLRIEYVCCTCLHHPIGSCRLLDRVRDWQRFRWLEDKKAVTLRVLDSRPVSQH